MVLGFVREREDLDARLCLGDEYSTRTRRIMTIAACAECQATWEGARARALATVHVKATGHAVFVLAGDRQVIMPSRARSGGDPQ